MNSEEKVVDEIYARIRGGKKFHCLSAYKGMDDALECIQGMWSEVGVRLVAVNCGDEIQVGFWM